MQIINYVIKTKHNPVQPRWNSILFLQLFPKPPTCPEGATAYTYPKVSGMEEKALGSANEFETSTDTLQRSAYTDC